VTIRRSNFHPYANPIADFTRRCGKTKSTAEFYRSWIFHIPHSRAILFYDLYGVR